ncbi:MAG: DUF1491 family protein [Rhodospirillaceae bacterium]
MAEPRLRVEIWVKAQLRLCDLAMTPAYVRRRGDPDAGAVILKLDRLDGTSELFTQTYGPDGVRAWTRGGGDGPVANAEAEAYLQRQLSFDPDIWVLEIEDPDRRYALDGPIL